MSMSGHRKCTTAFITHLCSTAYWLQGVKSRKQTCKISNVSSPAPNTPHRNYLTHTCAIVMKNLDLCQPTSSNKTTAATTPNTHGGVSAHSLLLMPLICIRSNNKFIPNVLHQSTSVQLFIFRYFSHECLFLL